MPVNNTDNQRVTNAIINEKLTTLIKTIEDFHIDEVKWRLIIEDRQRINDEFRLKTEVKILHLEKEAEDVCEDVEKLRGLSQWRDIGAYLFTIIAAAIASILGTSK